MRAASHRRPDQLREAVNRWRASFAAAGIEAICGALVLLRRRPGLGHWRRALSLAGLPAGLGERLPGIIAANDRLARGSDPFSARLCAAPGLDIERVQRPGEPERTTLRCPSALVTRRPAPPVLADVVLRLDGTCTPGDLLDDRSLASRIADLLKLGLLDYCGEDEALTSR